MKKIAFLLSVFLFICARVYANYSPALLTSTEADPDSFVAHCINVLQGDYCEAVTDLSIIGPDALLLQRFYNSKNYVTGEDAGSWRIFPQQFLVLGQDQSENLDRTYAFAGERSGGILTYSGYRNEDGITENPLQIDVFNDNIGMVNTYSKDISGQTNHKNNELHCEGSTCEMTLGDGSKRIYQKVNRLPTVLLGEECVPFLANQVIDPEYFHLIQETLPSGNVLIFNYNSEGHLAGVEMKNGSLEKQISWIHLTYEFQQKRCLVKIVTSDERSLEYHFTPFVLSNGTIVNALTEVKGSHMIPCTYKYHVKNTLCLLKEKSYSPERFIHVEYDKYNRVSFLKEPHPDSGEPVVTFSFDYEDGCTEVLNAAGIKTNYKFDDRFRLTAIEKFDSKNNLIRIDQKIWGKKPENVDQLMAKTISDSQAIQSYCAFKYDLRGNILEKQLYGNLTGKTVVNFKLNAENQLLDAKELECFTTSYKYSENGFNLLLSMGETAANQITYLYKTGTNLCVRELDKNKGKINKRLFRIYNEDGVCIQIIEDDGSKENETDISEINERHITKISPKLVLPGVGLPEIHEKMAYDRNTNKILLEHKHINIFDPQGNLLSCETYDANDQFAYKEEKTYLKGRLNSETNPFGHVTSYTYDDYGNPKTITTSSDNKVIQYNYNFRDQPTIILETIGDFKLLKENKYDDVARKIASIDFFGNATQYFYDDFGRLSKMIFPPVYDEYKKITHPTFTYEYDIFGNVIRETDPNGFTTQKSYVLRGPSKVDYPDGTTEIFIYHLRGELHRTLSRDRIYTVYDYDDQGRVTCKNSLGNGKDAPEMNVDNKNLTYKGFRCIQSQDKTVITKYEFDPFGRPTLITLFPKYETTTDTRQYALSYNSLGLVSQKKTWFDHGENDYSIEYFEYDFAGNVLSKSIRDHNESVLLQREYEYEAGRCTGDFEILNGKRVLLSKTSYNPLGEPISFIDEAGNETKVHVDYAHYNDLGQKVVKKTIINPIGVQTEIEFDALGRIVHVLKKTHENETLSKSHILYDAVGNKCCEIHDQISEGKILGTQSFRCVYGPMGRIDEESEYVNSIEKKKIAYTYNDLGQLISKTVPGFNQPLTFSYHATGKIQSVTQTDEKLPKDQQISNKYYQNIYGKIVEAKNSTNRSLVKRTFDLFEQMTSETIDIDQYRYTINYKYDRKGRIKSITLPDNSSIKYRYDALFCREITRLSKEGKVLYSHVYSDYDHRGRLVKEVLIGQAGEREYKYDSNSSLAEINIPKIHCCEQGRYDSLDRLTKVEKKEADLASSRQYTYNNLSQLILEKGLKENTYKYDSLDNKQSENGNILIYNALNQLQSSSNATFSYDVQGNLTKKTIGKANTNFESNVLSEILQIDKADSTKLTFMHDSLGRRLVKKHIELKGTREKVLSRELYIYLGDLEIGTINEKGKILQLRIPGISGDTLSPKSVYMEFEDKSYAPIHGIEGNVIALIDPITSSIVESYSYSAYGQEAVHDAFGNETKISTLGNPWRFAEKRIDKETGLIFFGRRYYDPEVGRWITPDPAGTLDGANPYAYLHNNPTNCFDQFGLTTEKSNGGTSYQYIYNNTFYYYYSSGHPTRPIILSGSYQLSGKKQENNLPKIKYDDNFENMHTHYESEEDFWENAHTHDYHFRPYYERSKVYDLNLPESPDLGIGFVNGMGNTYEHARGSTSYISRLASGYNVHGVYNATHGTMADLQECRMGLKHIATEPVRQLHKMWNNFFAKSSSKAKFLMICHSQGAIHVRNALLDYPEGLRSRILVVAIAPGGYIYEQTCAKVIHYRVNSSRDPVPRFDQAGAKRSKNSIVTLESHADAKAFDHEFMSPTYQEPLVRHISNYFSSQGQRL